jgi:hypothetical protein
MEKVVIKGVVRTVGELFVKGEFKKKSLIVETEGEYSQTLEVEFVNKKEELLDLVNVGETVEIGVNLRGRSWTNAKGEEKIFMSLAAWKIEVV